MAEKQTWVWNRKLATTCRKFMVSSKYCHSRLCEREWGFLKFCVIFHHLMHWQKTRDRYFGSCTLRPNMTIECSLICCDICDFEKNCWILWLFTVQRKLSQKIFDNISPTTGNFYTPFVCLYLRKITKKYLIISNFHEVICPKTCHIKHDHLMNCFTFHLKNAKKISATVWSISIKFNTMTQNMSLK